MIYRKPHQKSNRSVKKIEPQKQKLPKKQQVKKFTARPAPNMAKGPKIQVKDRQGQTNNKSVPQKVQQLQKLVDQIQKTKGNQQLQQMLLKEIRGIKSELKQIKNQIGMKNTHNEHTNFDEQHEQSYNNHKGKQFQHNYEQQDAQEQEQNIMNFNNKNNGSQLRQISHNSNNKNPTFQHYQNPKTIQSNVHISRPKIKSNYITGSKPHKKILIDIGKIQPYMKEFKLQPQSKQPQPFYYGYHKKTSKPIIIKYCQENKNMDYVIGLYEKLWKNIVKARTICINKLYDLNEPLATNIIVLQQNKCGLEGIQMHPLKLSQQILRALQFFHECGYLYRNLHPDHVMMSYQNNIVLIDLKKMKKFVDIKGKVIDVKGGQELQELDQFVANSRIKGALQGRKDDLECLGYLTLYMLEGKLPWNFDNMIQVRSKMTLNQIFGKYPNLLKFMIQVNKLPTPQMPNYNMFFELLNP